MIKQTRILYAEDNQNDIELTLAAFQEDEIPNRIDIVHNGREALDYLFCTGQYTNREKLLPDYMLLDIQMPGMSGLEVLKTIRESEECKNLPVVMLTSSSMDSDIRSCYESGVNGYVVKPIDFGDLIDAIKGIKYFWGEINTTPRKL